MARCSCDYRICVACDWGTYWKASPDGVEVAVCSDECLEKLLAVKTDRGTFGDVYPGLSQVLHHGVRMVRDGEQACGECRECGRKTTWRRAWTRTNCCSPACLEAMVAAEQGVGLDSARTLANKPLDMSHELDARQESNRRILGLNEGRNASANGPSREWLKAAGDIEDSTRSVSVGGLMVDVATREADAEHDPEIRPSYYRVGGIEVRRAAEAWGLDKDAYLFLVLKYIARAGKKDPAKFIRDLQKAREYIDMRIETAKQEGGGA